MTSSTSGEFVSQKLEPVHTWAMFQLLTRHVSPRAGDAFERTYVSTPGAVAIVAVTPQGEVVLVSQYRASFDAVVTEIPAGIRDVVGEPPELTAARELQEETGYIANELTFLGRCMSSPGVTDSVVEVFLARNVQPGTWSPHGPEEEAMVISTVAFDEALSMLDSGQLADAKTAYGLLMALRHDPELIIRHG
jgi:ADP-ribose pyrophosphatase